MESAASSPASTSSRVARNLFHMSPVRHYSYGTDSDECATPLRLSSPDTSPDAPRRGPSPSMPRSPVLRIARSSPRRSSPRFAATTAALLTPFKCLGNTTKLVIEESPDVVNVTPRNKKPPSKHTPAAQFYSPSSGISVGSFYSTGKPKARLSLFGGAVAMGVRPGKRSRSAAPDSRAKRARVEPPRLGNCRSGAAPRRQRRAEKLPVKKVPAVSPVERLELAEMDQVMAELNRPRLAPIHVNGKRGRVPATPAAAAAKSPEPDPSKKFFKTNRTMETNRTATVTLDAGMRLQVSNGKISLPPRRPPRTLFAPPPPADRKMAAAAAAVQLKVERIIRSLDTGSQGDTDSAFSDGPTSSEPELSANLSSPDTKMAAITSSTSKMALGEAASDPSTNQNLFPLFYKSFCPPEEQSPGGSRAPRGRGQAALAAVGAAQDQAQVDAGQRRFGHAVCAGCNLLYQMGEPDEERRHRLHHDRHALVKFPGWKQERVANVYEGDEAGGGGGGRVVLVTSADPKAWWRKVDQLMEAVDEEIGCVSSEEIRQLPDVKVALFVQAGRAVGCAVAHALRTANRLLPSLDGVQCCAEREDPVVMGIARIWVAADCRRRRVASRLVDCLRSTFVYGAVLSMKDFAFSVPTEAGAAFARKYTAAEDFLVYS